MRFGMHSQNSHLLVPAIKCSLKVIVTRKPSHTHTCTGGGKGGGREAQHLQRKHFLQSLGEPGSGHDQDCYYVVMYLLTQVRPDSLVAFVIAK